MTRQEAIKVLKKDLKIIDDPKVTMTAREWEEHDDHMRDALEMAIEALEQEPKWIPVTERLPEIGETVIISGRMKYKHEKEYEYFVDVAFYESWQGFSTFNDWYEGQDEYVMVAWQPLPEPYEEA